MKILIYAITILLLTSFFSILVNAQVEIDLESGFIFTGYNDVRISGDQGTLFSLKDDLQDQTEIFYRLRASYTIKSRHTISLLYAPLETESEGSVPHIKSPTTLIFVLVTAFLKEVQRTMKFTIFHYSIMHLLE